MMKISEMPKYDDYVDSGVEWLGRVPASWELTRLGTRFNERRSKVSDIDYPALSVTKKGVLPQLDNAAKTKDGDNRKLVKEGDFVINSRSDRKGSSGVSDRDGSVSLINIVLKPKGIHPKFSEHLLKSHAFIEEYYRVGRGIVADLWTTRYDEMRTITISVPSLEEQTRIANFLDKKTAQIDDAIAIKEQQISLLKERKQIIIQQAVTQGLDPNVPMKDSGVDWIGKVPAHWEVKKMKTFARIKNGIDYKHVESDSGYSVYGSGGQFTFANRFLYKGEAVLLGRKGTIDKPLYVNEAFWTVDTMFYAVCNTRVVTKYLYFCATTIPFGFYSTATALPSMTQTDLLNHKFAVPSFSEQLDIIAFIEDKEFEIEECINLQRQQISKLKEYKTTLINSAVTGKIKITPEMVEQ
ncbi:restriction endonuclease subunit S [Escherichia coli]|uniref:restriction endonuclease subunit S n=1 Tax=Escherichia coli TaxID=562 RepID=UPI001495C60D|nr:restriction endonuclease subunit S [Escherichia coli]MBP2820637.1 restriction endonuclease subunit S [Escherichia coli]MEB7094718.1 restriction endonuclease subunit S [Escherichia coli]NPO08842.1 restriction endonuclease subunit S [Escherichia coli]